MIGLLALLLTAAPAPYRFVEGVRLGVAEWRAPLTGPDASPARFWQGTRFCVVQQDESRTMRCFDAVTRAWGARVPVAQRVPFVPHLASSVRFDVCRRVGAPCVSGYAFIDAVAEDAWVGVSADRLWLARDPMGAPVLETLSEERASVLAAKGPGGSLFGGARYWLRPTPGLDGFVAAPIAHPEARWAPLPDAPAGLVWRDALVSPDQQAVAVFAYASGGAADAGLFGEWWLFHIVENR